MSNIIRDVNNQGISVLVGEAHNQVQNNIVIAIAVQEDTFKLRFGIEINEVRYVINYLADAE